MLRAGRAEETLRHEAICGQTPMKRFHGARIILPDRVVEDGVLLAGNGIIHFAGDAVEAPVMPEAERVDLGGLWIGPGFVDLHCHGGGAFEAFEDPVGFMEYHLAGGTTAILPTLGYDRMQPGTIPAQLDGFLSGVSCAPRSTFAGFHLEGPYMNPNYGAKSEESPMRLPDESEYRDLIARYGKWLKLWSFAPELEGTDAFIKAARAAGITLSIGHSEATVERVAAVAEMGVSQACHALNATGLMPPPSLKGVRQPGLDEAVMTTDSMVAEVIPDRAGVHVHPVFLRLLFRAKRAERLIIITDCTADRDRIPRRPDDDVHYNDRGQLSGSRLRMIEAARNFQHHTGCSLPELFRMSSLNPAKAIGQASRRGSLEAGKSADFVVIDQDLKMKTVYWRGHQASG